MDGWACLVSIFGPPLSKKKQTFLACDVWVERRNVRDEGTWKCCSKNFLGLAGAMPQDCTEDRSESQPSLLEQLL